MTLGKVYLHGIATGGLLALGVERLFSADFVTGSTLIGVAALGFLWMLFFTKPPALR